MQMLDFLRIGMLLEACRGVTDGVYTGVMSYRPLTFGQKARLAWMAFIHPRTPFGTKALLIGGLLYGITPMDIIPDVLPFFGISDDAAVLVVVILLFLRMTKGIRNELRHREGY